MSASNSVSSLKSLTALAQSDVDSEWSRHSGSTHGCVGVKVADASEGVEVEGFAGTGLDTTVHTGLEVTDSSLSSSLRQVIPWLYLVDIYSRLSWTTSIF